MAFFSILFTRAEASAGVEAAQAPEFFHDLGLDQVVDAITAAKQDYNLKPFFYTALHDHEAIEYRQRIMQDLESPALFQAVTSFAGRMRAMRQALAQADKLHYKYQKESWFMDAAAVYCDAVRSLARDLASLDLHSSGFLGFRAYLADYAASDGFTTLSEDIEELRAGLAGVRYCVLIRGSRVLVRKYESEADYSAQVEKTFAKFKQGAVKDYQATFPSYPDMNHVEAQILDLVARLYPEVFQDLDAFYSEHHDYLDATVATFDREVQFYIAYLEHIAPLKRAGLKFCYPEVSTSKDVYDREGFDLALAQRLVGDGLPVVCNDFYLEGEERIFIVSGPNQGGKTTFARTFGQLHYLASLGCPVAGSQARLFLYDRIFTHFEREEEIQNLRGKLQDDLVRIHTILNQATPNSILIMNEIFTSTTLQDAVLLSRKIMERVMELDLLCVWVTFIGELATLSKKAVSMVSTVSAENPAVRTYKVLRKPADGLTYAISIAEKYRLTYERLKERIRTCKPS